MLLFSVTESPDLHRLRKHFTTATCGKAAPLSASESSGIIKRVNILRLAVVERMSRLELNCGELMIHRNVFPSMGESLYLVETVICHEWTKRLNDHKDVSGLSLWSWDWVFQVCSLVAGTWVVHQMSPSLTSWSFASFSTAWFGEPQWFVRLHLPTTTDYVINVIPTDSDVEKSGARISWNCVICVNGQTVAVIQRSSTQSSRFNDHVVVQFREIMWFLIGWMMWKHRNQSFLIKKLRGLIWVSLAFHYIASNSWCKFQFFSCYDVIIESLSYDQQS